ncbi:Phosphoribosylaminoimidazole-succinocarboxamide synthase [Luteitalea pratensis]|uniref:Phosphoribosylaminoimidazole-succinocarboxamide synthase n=1 Tax=Luteitalea pratensis TaxID=1855912 RepID=A0A143PQW6_LUTPR|nr:phosphoribosylaminoimidazolesuccinocarboxamide synthase [Luteitalea pratensis]AMY10995.1 Phosphoribosylaminoimidazole-succinocarboxamide synthase [Luteitalea pratensis]
MSASPLLSTPAIGLPLLRRGKVRDVFEAGDDQLLIVATDRISAFDHVLGSGIPDKGRILTQLSAFWFGRLGEVTPHHVLSTDVADFPAATRSAAADLAGRSMLVRRTRPLPVECVARGYLEGSGWKDYQATGTLCGHHLPAGLRQCDQLPAPLFTPATKAESGHDENITEAQAAAVLGPDVFSQVKALTLALYTAGAAHAAARGILVADTKFEFGLVDQNGTARVILIDEVLTPDSSRFWPADQYAPGGPQPSFDKQFVREYLERIAWNKQPPVPSLPDDVVARTRDKYLDAFRRLTGADLA